jgi:adenylate cyclase
VKKIFTRFITINPFSITLGSILLVIALFFTGVSILEFIELKAFDLRFLSRKLRKPTYPIVLAVIDEKSLDVEGRWPWPRSKFARLIDYLSADGAKVIGFDIGFLEPDENSSLQVINKIESKLKSAGASNTDLSQYLNDIKKDADNDLALADSIKKSSATVVLGYFFHTSQQGSGYRISPAEIENQLKRIESSRYQLIISEGQEPAESPFLRAYAPESNLKLLSQATPYAGWFNTIPDYDGVLRWAPMVIQCGDDIFPPLALEAVWNYLDQPQRVVQVEIYGVEGIHMGQRFIPTDSLGRMLINYLGPPKTFPQYSISDILKGMIPKGTFKDAIVLVGATAEGIYDSRNTPFSTVHPGLEVHANIAEDILSQSYLNIPKRADIYNLIAIMAMGIVVGMVLPRLNALKGALFALTLFGFYIVANSWLFSSTGIWFNMVYPLLALLIAYVAITVYRYFTEERQRKEIKSAFSRNASKRVIDQMLDHPDQLKLGGEVKPITVLFCDLAGFTSYSEIYTPNAMIDILGEYFNEMTEQVFAFEGLLKEYVGDELMAIFGAPLTQEDHAQKACLTALAMKDRLQTLRQIWAELDRPQLKARTGINSGHMLVGNIGSKYRFSYGALGDDVNLGSRLEGLNKQYGTEILIGENTADLVKDNLRLRKIDYVRVKGKEKPVRVYELLGVAGIRFSEEKERQFQIYNEGFEAYQSQKWSEAYEIFKSGRNLYPKDKSFKTMTIRCRIYQKDPPTGEWDGAFRERRK